MCAEQATAKAVANFISIKDLSSRRTPFGLAPDGAAKSGRRAVALAKPEGFGFFSLAMIAWKKVRCEAPQGRPAVAADAARPRSASASKMRGTARER